jgi:hypothetical protein
VSVPDVLKNVQESMSARRVFAEPYEKDGLTIIPAAKVRGGGGGGQGDGPQGQGAGGGFGVMASPMGAYVVRGDEVEWKPALDWNRLLFGAEAITLTAVVLRHRRAKARRFRTPAWLRLAWLAATVARFRRRPASRRNALRARIPLGR